MGLMQQPIISVTWGEELYSFHIGGEYMQFRVGPYTYTTQPLIGETEAKAWKRAWAVVEEQAAKVYLAKRNGFFDRVEKLKK